MLHASQALLVEVLREADLLIYDYSVVLTPGLMGTSPWRFGGGSAGDVVTATGRPYSLNIYPGHCSLDGRSSDGSIPHHIDLRRENRFVDDNKRELVITRRKRGLAWIEALPPLIAFLSDLSEPTLMIHNHHQ